MYKWTHYAYECTAIQVVYCYVLHLIWTVNTMTECQHLYFKQEDQSVRMNEQRTDHGAQQVLQSE